MSLSDELARAIERQLAIPFVFTALVHKSGAELDLRDLSRAEKYQVVRGEAYGGLRVFRERATYIQRVQLFSMRSAHFLSKNYFLSSRFQHAYASWLLMPHERCLRRELRWEIEE